MCYLHMLKHAQIYETWMYNAFRGRWCLANSISLLWICCNDFLHYSRHIYNSGPVMQAIMYSTTGKPYDHANSPGFGPRSCLSNLSSSKKVADTVRPPKNLPPRSMTDCNGMPRREHHMLSTTQHFENLAWGLKSAYDIRRMYIHTSCCVLVFANAVSYLSSKKLQ